MTPSDKHLRSKCVDQALTIQVRNADHNVKNILDTAEQIWDYINSEAKERTTTPKAPAKKKDGDFG